MTKLDSEIKSLVNAFGKLISNWRNGSASIANVLAKLVSISRQLQSVNQYNNVIIEHAKSRLIAKIECEDGILRRHIKSYW